jgi:hypothetical protein
MHCSHLNHLTVPAQPPLSTPMNMKTGRCKYAMLTINIFWRLKSHSVLCMYVCICVWLNCVLCFVIATAERIDIMRYPPRKVEARDTIPYHPRRIRSIRHRHRGKVRAPAPRTLPPSWTSRKGTCSWMNLISSSGRRIVVDSVREFENMHFGRLYVCMYVWVFL